MVYPKGLGTLALLLALAGCDAGPVSDGVGTETAAVEPPAAEAAIEDASLATVDLNDPQVKAMGFRAAWGKAPPALHHSQREWEDQTYSKSSLIDLGQGLYALLSEGHGGEAHASAGSLAVHYLMWTGSGFEKTGAWPALIHSGSWGSPPSWVIRKDLMEGPAVVASAGGTWQGYTCGWSDIIELTPSKPVVRIDKILMGYSDGGARMDGQTTDVEGEIMAGQKGRTLRVRYAGDVKGTVVYAKVGEVYDPVDPLDLPTC